MMLSRFCSQVTQAHRGFSAAAVLIILSLLLHAERLFAEVGKIQSSTSLEQTPKGLATSDWQSIRAAYEAGRHAFQPVENGWQARNPGQRWLTTFDQRGFMAKPQDGNWTWGLELQSYGFGAQQQRISGTPAVTAEGQRLSYQWDTQVQEWFVNDQRGLEHGFTVAQRPGPSGSAHLSFLIGTRGSLHPSVTDDALGVLFKDAEGATVLNYTGLKVWDADGKILVSRFEAAGDKRVRLLVDERTARYPITIDPVAQQAYLKASNTGVNDYFGISVAVSGDTVVIGANGEGSNATGVGGSQADNSVSSSGAVYVFTRSGTTWTQQAYLKASNTGANDGFGTSVVLSGDTLVVAASGEDSNATGVGGDQANNSALNSGAAYVFTRSGTTWSQQAYLKASNTAASDNFGFHVALSGDTVVIGATGEDSNATGVGGDQANNSALGAGAAYVFTRSGTTWSQQAYLKASNTAASDQFGYSVAVSGDTVVIGATGEDSNATGVGGDQSNNSANISGAAYVFTRSGTTWSQQAYLKASNTEATDSFGRSVALSGDTAVIGAVGEDSNATGVGGNQANNSALSAGAAYVFTRSGTTWSQQAYLKASNTREYCGFGGSVALSGDTVLIGAGADASNATGVDGNQSDLNANQSGAAYAFTRSGTTWSQQAYLKASNTGVDDYFGTSVAVSGDTAVIGAYQEDSNATGVGGTQTDNSAPSSGAAYIFTGLGAAAPEIAVEQPVGTNIADGGTKNLGDVLAGSAPSFTFSLKNTGSVDLTGLGITKDGTDAGLFTVTADPVAPVSGPSGSTPFMVRFAPGSAGSKSAALHIASNDTDENPFDINLTGTGVTTLTGTFASAATVPLTTEGLTATGNSLNLALGFAPPVGTDLTVVSNTAAGAISGTFTSVTEGVTAGLLFNATPYYFTATYLGGDGNDFVLRGNRDPVAVGDAVVTSVNVTRTLSESALLANDSPGAAFESAQTLSITAISANSAQGGTVSLAGGVITYVPSNNFSGSDSFTYTLSDGLGGTTTGTVTVEVNASSAVVLDNGGLQVTTPTTIENPVTLGSTTTITGSQTVTFNGPVTLSGVPKMDIGTTVIINGVITGGSELEKTGSGTLVLAGANTNTGGIKISGGTVEIASDQALGTGTVTLNGGNLTVTGSARTVPNTIVMLTDTTVRGQDLNLTGTVTVTGQPTLTVESDVNISGNVSGSAPTAALTKAGSGTLTLAPTSNTQIAVKATAGTIVTKGSISPSIQVVSNATSKDVGMFANQILVGGFPAMAFCDSRSGDILYVRATNSSGTAWGSLVRVVNLGTAGYPSLQMVDGRPAIAYYEANGANLWFVRANDATGATWGASISVASTGDVGSYASLQILANNKPAISYYDGSKGDLVFVRANDISGTTWATPLVVDSRGNVGKYTSMAIIDGKPAISFYDVTNGDLRFAHANDAEGLSWRYAFPLDTKGNVGMDTCMRIINTVPAISYYDQTNNGLKYVIAGDPTGAAWVVPKLLATGGVGTGRYSSLQVVNGTPAISFYAVSSKGGRLGFKRSSTMFGTAWDAAVFADYKTNVGKYTSLLVVNGVPGIAHYDYTNKDVRYHVAKNANGSDWNLAALAQAERATVKGTNVTTQQMQVSKGGTLSNGASPGVMTVAGAMAWEGGSLIEWEINNATGTAGVNWDVSEIGGALAIDATSADPIVLNVVSLTEANNAGDCADFNPFTAHTWRLATATGGITGFATDKFEVHAPAFSNSLYGGAFSIVLAGNDLNVVFTPGPITNPNITVEVAGLPLVSEGPFLGFGTLAAGSQTTRTFTIRNDGADPLTGVQLVAPVLLEGGDDAEVILSPPNEDALNPGESTTFEVTLINNAVTAIPIRASFEIESNDPSDYRFLQRVSANVGDPESPTTTITNVAPAAGSSVGGTSVVITGTGFTGATAVSFGGTNATSFSVDSATQITAMTPAHAAGLVDVVVTTPSGMGTGFYTYLARHSLSPVVISAFDHQVQAAMPPAIMTHRLSDTVTFPSGPGTFSGPGFTASIGSDDVVVARFEAPAGSKFTVHRPVGAQGVIFFVSAVWRTGVGDLFNVPNPTPTVTFENLTGQAPMSIYNFTDISDNGEAINIQRQYNVTSEFSFSALQIEFVVPAGLAKVMRTYGAVQSDSSPSFGARAFFASAPTDQPVVSIGLLNPIANVTNVAPATGSTAGGASVVITGTDFTGATAVTFGGTNATSFNVDSATQITATVPAGSVGAASVLVTTPGGTSLANTLYTYVAPNTAPSFTLPVGATSPAGGTWTAQVSGSRQWYSITSSADGSKLAAVEYGGKVYTSIDSGVTWTPRDSNRYWTSIASSSDGSKLAAVTSLDQIYTSTDSGATWTPRESSRMWLSITSSDDGSKLAAVVSNGEIYTSTDSGVNWTPRESNRLWRSIASSADGTQLVAVAAFDQIYTSTNSGVNWTPRESNRIWQAVTSSADGSKLAAVENGGQIYTSINGGVTWTARQSSRTWTSITSSSDGSKLAATSHNGQIYTSTDSGVTWTAQDSNRNWYAITSSADGSKLAAAVQVGLIYTSTSSTLPYDVSVPASSGLSTTVGFATDISPGPVADAGQTVSFTVSNNNQGLFLTQPAIASNGTLTFTPGNTMGVATVTVTASDDGGTAYGGVDTSAEQTFTITLTAPVATVTLVTPDTGSTAGGTSVTITGTDFTGASAVTFGGTNATSFTVDSATQITATTPTGIAGVASVRVTTPAGTSVANTLYTYVAPNTAPSFTLPAGVETPAGATWTALATDQNWRAIASSTDGTKLAAAVNGGPIYTSTDSGVSWTAQASGSLSWRSIASSADGSKLAAAVLSGQIYTSTDSGVSWTAQASGSRSWRSITSSADGSKLAAVAHGGQIYTSDDSGVTWMAREINRFWIAIASSADGTKLAAAVQGGQIYTSTDSGLTWTARSSNKIWSAIASSADGTKLVAADYGANLYTSTDSGVTWTSRFSPRAWVALTSSADGVKLAALDGGGRIYTSVNSGVNWTMRESDRNWYGITSSADGNKLAAVVEGGQIYTSVGSTTLYNLTVAASSGLSTTVGFASNISPGPMADAGQTVSFTVSNNNQGLFLTQPAIASNGTLTFTPGYATGVATVTVTAMDDGGTAYGGVNTSAEQTFTITLSAPPAPTVTQVSPVMGTTTGGTIVTITGTNLAGASAVTFGGTNATSYTVDSATQITATTPAHAAGAVDVAVTTAGGTTAANTLFTYVVTVPTLTSLLPDSGSTDGGTLVTITGTNFTDASSVTFDGIAASSVAVVNATTITAMTPARATVGSVSVLITTPGGTNVANTAFTYTGAAPTITVEPVGGAFPVYSTVALSVTSTGTASLSYQWSKDSVEIQGATQPTYTIVSLVSADAGSYTVVVTNLYGSDTSAPAVVSLATRELLNSADHLPVPGFPMADLYRPLSGVLAPDGSYVLNAMASAGVGGITSANDQVIITNASGSVQVIGQEGQTVGSGTMSRLFYYLNARGNGAAHYRAVVTTGTALNDTAYFTSPDGQSLEILSQEGDEAPEGGVTFTGHISPSAISQSGIVYFDSKLMGSGVTTKNDTGVWFDNEGDQGTLAREGDRAPTGSSVADQAWYSQILAGSVVAGTEAASFIAELQADPLNATNKTDGLRNAAVFTGTEDAVSVVARKGDVIADLPVRGFSAVAASREGGHAFTSTLTQGGAVNSGNAVALFYKPAVGAPVLVAQKGQNLPGAGTINVFERLFVADGGQVIFEVTLNNTATADNALCRWTEAGGVEVMAHEGDAAPGGGVYGTLRSITVSGNGNLLIQDNRAVWRDVGDGLELVLAVGDSIQYGGVPRTALSLAINDETVNTRRAGGGFGGMINDDGVVLVIVSVGNGEYTAQVIP